ncbi:hypothetical protein LguiA_022432 [Lonicera macranthoides]
MEVIFLCENDNKENFPPIFSSILTNPSPSIPQSSIKSAKRRFRKPLRDITNLFNSQNSTVSASLFTQLQQPKSFDKDSASGFNSRKRKAVEEIDSSDIAASKLLRKHFR